MITNEIEKTKQALTNIYTLEKAEFYLLRKEGNDLRYPDMFWRVKYFQDKRQVDERPKQKNWKLLDEYDVERLEEAVAYPVVKVSSNQRFEEVEIPDRLKKHWKPYCIVVEDGASIREGDVRTATHIRFYIQLTNGEWVLDYEERRNNFPMALTFIPEHFYWMQEGAVPWELSYLNNEDPKNNDIIGFMYKGHYFDQTLFIPDQKCICGESKTYHGDEGDGSIKVEVWMVDKFFDKDVVYLLDDQIFYNGEFYNREKIDNSVFISEEEKKKIRKMFPDVKSIAGEMEWINLAK